jgi:predicted flap endonuclease-1-like 5' DNA nuclease
MAATYPPNLKYAECFREMQVEAREAGRGLWAWRVYMPLAGRGSWCVDLNTAKREELQQIVHIGPVRATAIIAGRPWTSVDELVRIDGIGPSRLADIKEQGLACVR